MISQNFVVPFDKKDHSGWMRSRLYNAGMLVAEPLFDISDGVLGVIGALGSILTVGVFNQVNHRAMDQLRSATALPAHVVSRFVKTVNPDAYFPRSRDLIGHGYLSAKILDKMSDVFMSQAEASRVKWHLGLRAAALGFAVALVAARVGDAALTVIFVPLAILTLGTSDKINKIAYRTLEAGGVIADLYTTGMLFMNPAALESHD